MTMRRQHEGEEGYLLVGLVVAVFLILLALSVAAPTVAKSLERDREMESMHRAKQYVRAIQLFYAKNGRYPSSVDQLENTNNVRYLRRRYIDPLTGKEFRVIPVGQQQTQVKGFFGEPLQGIGGGGLGAASGMAASGIGSAPGTGNPGSPNTGSGFGSSSFGSGSASPTSGSTGVSGSSGAGGGFGSSPGSSSGQGSGIGSTNATDFKGSGAPFMGVGTTKTGMAILDWNGESDFEKWEFLYDPRVELLKQKVSILGGGGVASTSAGSFGTSAGSFGNSAGSIGTSSGSFGSGSSGSPGNGSNPTANPQQ